MYSVGNRVAKELMCMNNRGLPEGVEGAGQRGGKGEKIKTTLIAQSIYFKNKPTQKLKCFKSLQMCLF